MILLPATLAMYHYLPSNPLLYDPATRKGNQLAYHTYKALKIKYLNKQQQFAISTYRYMMIIAYDISQVKIFSACSRYISPAV